MNTEKKEPIIKEDKEDFIAILSHFETRASKDTQLLMRIAFEAGQKLPGQTYDGWMNYVKREWLNL